MDIIKDKDMGGNGGEGLRNSTPPRGADWKPVSLQGENRAKIESRLIGRALVDSFLTRRAFSLYNHTTYTDEARRYYETDNVLPSKRTLIKDVPRRCDFLRIYATK